MTAIHSFLRPLASSILLMGCLLCSFHSAAQVSCAPVFPNVDDDVTIFFDAAQGNGALVGISPVYIHTGVITNLSQSPSDWKHVTTSWAVTNAASTMQADGTNKWKKTFNIRQFYSIPANETVLKLAFVFRNAAGTVVGRATDGGDIFYDVFPENGPLQTILLEPSASALLKNLGDNIAVKAAASESATLTLSDNGTQIATLDGELLETNIAVNTPGLHEVLFVATTPTSADTARFSYIVPDNLIPQNPPAGTELGINYVNNQSVRLALYAPGKQVVYAIGDFNNWQPTPAYQMRKSVDGTLWWLDVGNLPENEPVRFQYLVDGSLKIADPLSTLVLDPWNDAFISPLTFPNLPAYPAGKTTGIVSVLQTAQTPFNWTATNYERPKKNQLIVYELLMRDFLARHDYQTMLDTLDYLEQLGVTAIELMPVNEFDGNVSWGYNPSFHKAIDKYYGSPEAFKMLVDECHHRGIAVILDVVFNHASGSSPLAQLYWDAANNRPAANNPWLNPTAKHDFNVFNDFNHESAATKTYTKNCMKYWLEEYKVDGFRFDLSKGFTQTLTLGNIALWGQYDASRVAIWKDYADYMWDIDPDSYVILEHFGDNPEEKELAQYGMMLWGNAMSAYKEVGLGNTGAASTSLSVVNYKQRGWSVPHLISYMESHDEERIAYELKTNGNSSVASYNIKTLPVGMRRIELLANLFYTVPGPKMLWEFGELGYDFPINYCENGTISTDCRLAPKPIRWDYLDNPYRRRLHDVTAALLNLRKNQDVFETTTFSMVPGTGKIREINLTGQNMFVKVIANVATTTETTTPTWAEFGSWYEYYSGDSIQVPDFGQPLSFSLAPGEYRLYTSEYAALPPGIVISATKEAPSALSEMEAYPNPVQQQFLVDFSLREMSDVQLLVTDARGRTLETLSFNRVPVGTSQVELDAATWVPGLYFVTLKAANGGQLARKVVKI